VVTTLSRGEGTSEVGITEPIIEEEPIGPQAIRVGDNDAVYILDTLNQRILCYDQDKRTFTEIRLLNIGYLRDLALFNQTFFVMGWDKVLQINSNGELINTFTVAPEILNHSSGIAVNNAGQAYWQVSGDREYKIVPDGKKLDKDTVSSILRTGLSISQNNTGATTSKFTRLDDQHGTLKVFNKYYNPVALIPIEVEHFLGSANLLGVDNAGNYYVLLEELLENVPAFVVETTVRKFTPEGKQLGAALVPTEGLYFVPHRFVDVAPTGEVYFLQVHQDEARILRLHFQVRHTSQLAEKWSARKNQLEISDPQRTQQPTTEDPITRDQIMSNAAAYVDLYWTINSDNLNGTACAGQLWEQPGYLNGSNPGDQIIGMPYKWGGFSSVPDFLEDMSTNKAAGDSNTNDVLSCASGVDCSGFVSRAWNLSYKRGTSTFSDISESLDDWQHLRQGDAVNNATSHIALFDSFNSTGINTYEATAGCNWKVCGYSRSYTYLDTYSYVPIRYDHVIETEICAHPDIPNGVGAGTGAQDGYTSSYIRDRMCEAYLRNRQYLGEPADDNGGGEDVHWWGESGYQVQNFSGSEIYQHDSIMVFNPDVGAAFVVKGDIWDKYRDPNDTPDDISDDGVLSWLKAPISDEMDSPHHLDNRNWESKQVSYFDNGFIEFGYDKSTDQWESRLDTYSSRECAPFCDAPKNHQFFHSIKGIYDNKMTNGCHTNVEDRKFYCTQAPISLSQLAMMLARHLYGIKDPIQDLPSVSEAGVEDNQWNRVIDTLRKDEILNGLKGNLFEPDRLLTRAEVVDIIVRALLLPRSLDEYVDANLYYYLSNPPFNDIIGNQYKRSIVLAWWLGIAGGWVDPDNSQQKKFGPDQLATRSHTAAFLCRAFLDECEKGERGNIEALRIFKSQIYVSPGIKMLSQDSIRIASTPWEHPDVNIESLHDYSHYDAQKDIDFFWRQPLFRFVRGFPGVRNDDSIFTPKFRSFVAINGSGFVCDDAIPPMPSSLPYLKDYGYLSPDSVFHSLPEFDFREVVDYESDILKVGFFVANSSTDAAIVSTYDGNQELPHERDFVESLLNRANLAIGYSQWNTLIRDGIIAIHSDTNNHLNNENKTAIGIRSAAFEDFIYFATADENISLEYFAQQLIADGVEDAIVLDGGGSSQFYSHGKTANRYNFSPIPNAQCLNRMAWGEPRWILNGLIMYNDSIDPTSSVSIDSLTGGFYQLEQGVSTIFYPVAFGPQTDQNKVSISENNVSSNMTLTLHYIPQPISHTFPLQGIGRFYSLYVTDDSGSLVTPQKPYTMTLVYDPSQIPSNIDESDLAFYYFETGKWVREPTSMINTEINTITATPSQFRQWAVLAKDIKSPRTTFVRLDKTQVNPQAAYRVTINAILNNQRPLILTQPFTITESSGITTYPAGTVIIPKDIEGNFTKHTYLGEINVPSAMVLYRRPIKHFESASEDERASWELPDQRRALETYLWLHEWPLLDEASLAADADLGDIVFLTAGVTPDVENRFIDTGAADALWAQAQAGRWFVCQGDACSLFELSGLVPSGTVQDNALDAGLSELVTIASDELLSFNWPEGMQLQRYSDAPYFSITEDLVRVADYADNGEAAIVLRRIGNGGVIMFGGHPAQQEETYGLLYHALFTAAAERVNSRVDVLSSPRSPLLAYNVVPGGEQNVDGHVGTTIDTHQPINDFVFTEFITDAVILSADPVASTGTVTTTQVTTGTKVMWTAQHLPSGQYTLEYPFTIVVTDALKAGDLTVSQAGFSYTEPLDGQTTRSVNLTRPDAIVSAKLAADLIHYLTAESSVTYPLKPEGFWQHYRVDLANIQETRAQDIRYQLTLPLITLLMDAFDQTTFPHVEGTQENVWFLNTIQGYPELDYPSPNSMADTAWEYSLGNWDGYNWVRIPNPQGITVSIPSEYANYVIQEPNNGDLLVAGVTLNFDLGTLLAYDHREPTLRFRIHSQEIDGHGVSFSSAPVDGTLVVEGDAGSVYTVVGQNPVPFREYFSDSNLNNPVAPMLSQLMYYDVWGRLHTITETVRSGFYDILPYPGSGYGDTGPRDVQFARTYELTDANGHRLPDYATYQDAILTLVLRVKSNRTVPLGEILMQEMLPRGLNYDITLIEWEASDPSWQLVPDYTQQLPTYELLAFEGALSANEAQTITIQAHLRTYPNHPREGHFVLDYGSSIASRTEPGGPGQFDLDWSHVIVERGYQSSLQLEKWGAYPSIPRQGGQVFEVIRVNGSDDVQPLIDEVCMDSTGTGDKTAVVRTGGSWGPDLHFCKTTAGDKTLIVLEVTNNSGVDWHNVVPVADAPPGFTLTQIYPNDIPHTSNDIPDVSSRLYYYEVQVDESVAPGVVYPIAFTLTGDNVPDADEFPLPVARVGVGDNVRQVLGQAYAINIIGDSFPDYATPVAAKFATAEEFDVTATFTDPDTQQAQWEAFFDGLAQAVSIEPAGDHAYSYLVPSDVQTLPDQDGTNITEDWYLIVKTEVDQVDPGTLLLNNGPWVDYVDDFDTDLTALGNKTQIIATGPALVGSYSVESSTHPFYNRDTISVAPGDQVDLCVDLAIRNVGNYIASDPVVTATLSAKAADLESTRITPEPIGRDGLTLTWALEDILPYGAGGDDPDLDTEHIQICLRLPVPKEDELPTFTPLLTASQAQYVNNYDDIPFTIHSKLGQEYGVNLIKESPKPLYRKLYLPVLLRDHHEIWWPDLTINEFSVTPENPISGEPAQVLVVVKNEGNAPAGPFWVDFYTSPDPVPTAPGQRWDQVCGVTPCDGIAWLVNGLDSGGTITLTSTTDSYAQDQTRWTGGFRVAGTHDLYIYVDSWNGTVPEGGVVEENEANNRAAILDIEIGGATQLHLSAPRLLPDRQKPKEVNP